MLTVEDLNRTADTNDDTYWNVTYDWHQAFEYASVTGEACGEDGPQAVVGDEGVDLAPFDHTNVAEIIGSRQGCNDEESWRCAGRLNDGRWFYLDAWCDYTGWD
jgi:hypothetical protein